MVVIRRSSLKAETFNNRVTLQKGYIIEKCELVLYSSKENQNSRKYTQFMLTNDIQSPDSEFQKYLGHFSQ